VVDKTIRILATIPTTGTFNVTQNVITSHIFGGPDADVRIRLKGISVWGTAEANSRIRVVMGLDNSDEAQFEDSGTQGSRRAAVHIRPGLLSRIDWHVGNGTSVLFTIDADGTTPTAFQAVVHVKVQMRLKAPTS
jgi:hypothetical protein